MKLLDAVNLIMPKLGERPVTSLAVKHPTLAVLLPIIEQTRRSTLNRGWWFNEYASTLYPDTDGVIAVGTETLSFVPDMAGTAIVRGSELFNPVTLTNVFSAPVKGCITQDMDFDLLPESAATYVFYSALVEAFTTDIGVTQELGVWQTRAGQGWSDMLAEHLRQVKPSTRQHRAWRRLIRAKNA